MVNDLNKEAAMRVVTTITNGIAVRLPVIRVKGTKGRSL